MKNLITILTLATVSLAACYKEPKTYKQPKDTNPKIGIYGHLIDSNGRDMGSGKFHTSTLSPSTLLHAASNHLVSQFKFSTYYDGNFQVTIRVAEQGDSIYIYPDTPMQVIRAAAFKVNPPIEKWIDVGTLKMISYYK
ncbi:MAG: hypothetical protein EOP51_09480 [Sphingobacteriales bacterium]|nr:MAG: hypothetical protein EOP51_09480 [Sphingobacteriales bacterium]